jgi:hypothetical protein
MIRVGSQWTIYSHTCRGDKMSGKDRDRQVIWLGICGMGVTAERGEDSERELILHVSLLGVDHHRGQIT